MTDLSVKSTITKRSLFDRFYREISKNRQLYILMVLPVIYLLVFKYYPMLGLQIAFKNYFLTKGIWGSPWIGLDHFRMFFNSYLFWRVLKNTLMLSLYSLVASFFMSIMFSLCLNYLTSKKFRRTVQMVTYAPHFISTVVMVAILMQFLSYSAGPVNAFIKNIGQPAINFMGESDYFRHIYVWSGLWQNLGYSSIIYFAALSNIPPELHEAAVADGANKPQRIWFIDIPGIMPTAVILLIMQTGNILNVGYEKVLLMQNPLNLETAEIIDTYVYKSALFSTLPMFSYASAIGFFQSLIGLILLLVVNSLGKKVSGSSLW